MKEKIVDTFNLYWDHLVDLVPDLILAGIFVTIFIFIGIFAGRTFKQRQKMRHQRSLVANFGGSIIKWVFWVIGLTIAMNILHFGTVVSGLLAGAGISALILGFAFKDIAENFLGGLLLAFNRPFQAGDIIEVADNRGVVRNLNLRTTHIRVSDGRDIFIPNSMIISNVLTNYTADGLLRHDFVVGLDSESDLIRAREIILETLEPIGQVLQTPAPDMRVVELAESSINVQVTFWVDQFKGPKNTDDGGPVIKSVVIQAVRDCLFAHGFTMPAQILEHKIYQENSPIPIKVLGEKQE